MILLGSQIDRGQISWVDIERVRSESAYNKESGAMRRTSVSVAGAWEGWLGCANGLC